MPDVAGHNCWHFGFNGHLQDRLIIRVRTADPHDDTPDGDDAHAFVSALIDELVRIGLKERAFIVTDPDVTIELTVVSRAAPE